MRNHSHMRERWPEAFEAWAADHPWAATFAGIAFLSGLITVGFLASGQGVALSLIAGGVVGAATFLVLALATAITGRPVLFAIFGGRPARGEVDYVPYDGDGGWGDGGWGAGGGGDSGGSG